MRIDVDDITMELEAYGSDGPVVLLVHGLGGCRGVWTEVATHIGRKARALVPDLRGCGGSTRGSAPYTLARVADDLAALLRALGETRVVAVGHSLGGVLVQELMVRHGHLLAGAVLVSTSSRLNATASRNWKKLADMVEAKGLSTSPESQARSFSESFAAAHPEVLAAHAALAATADPRVYAEQARAASEYDYTDALATVSIPTLVVQGLADRLTPPGGSVLLQRALPASRLEMIEGAGHNLPVEMPERFARLVLDFIDELGRS
ncbi:MAG TPA: alpha/beta fold hydrolase [Candidatus Limnocylindrales bacterium]|nr:alpha/beta fold hydrolase [Candidatus Limnocylindrales bacterium]